MQETEQSVRSKQVYLDVFVPKYYFYFTQQGFSWMCFHQTDEAVPQTPKLLGRTKVKRLVLHVEAAGVAVLQPHTKGSHDLSWQLPKQQGRGKLWPAHSSTASNRSDESREHRAAITGHCVSGMSRCAAGTDGHIPSTERLRYASNGFKGASWTYSCKQKFTK